MKLKGNDQLRRTSSFKTDVNIAKSDPDPGGRFHITDHNMNMEYRKMTSQVMGVTNITNYGLDRSR